MAGNYPPGVSGDEYAIAHHDSMRGAMQSSFPDMLPDVRRIGLDAACPFIERWHYSGRVPTGMNLFFGWARENEMMYAVACYGIGVNPFAASFLARASGQPVTTTNLLELKRLCRVDPRQESMPLSMFLARCHKMIRRLGYKYIVAFSDPAHGHSGGIYRASNFAHLGTTAAEIHLVDAGGQPRHRRYPFRYARRKGISIAQARLDLGLTRTQTPPKDRWLIAI